MTDTSAKILAKGCKNTGLTPELAQQLFAGGRTHVLAIVELQAVKNHESRLDGKNAVDLAITTIEPVVARAGTVESTLDEHVRTLQSALHYERRLAEGGDQLPFGEEDGPAPKVSDLVQQGSALVERDDDGEVAGIWSGEDQAETSDAAGGEIPSADPFAVPVDA